MSAERSTDLELNPLLHQVLEALAKPLVAICGRVAAGPSLVAGATKHLCVRCGAWVWVSPSTLAARPDRIVCVPCHGGDAAVAQQLAAGQISLRPEQLPEIERVASRSPEQGAALRRAAAEALSQETKP